MAREPHEVAGGRTAAIRSDIEQTRTRIATTIDAIEARVRPSRLMSGARKALTDTAARPVRTMQMHPLVSMLVALGTIVIAGEFFRRRRQRSERASS